MSRPRVRVRLLVLLWVWAVCVFATLDLFLNVGEFDTVRPRSRTYRSMRFAAHRMVGEHYQEDDEFGAAVRDQAPAAPQLQRPEEIQAILDEARERPEPGLTDLLLEIRSRIPDDPEVLGAYALAAASVVAHSCAGEAAHGYPRGQALTGAQGALALAAFEAQARRLELGTRDWTGIRITLERIAWVAPDCERTAAFMKPLDVIRNSVEEYLLTPCDPNAVTLGRVAALRLTSVVGDKETADLCLASLTRLVGDGVSTREAALMREHAVRTVVRKGGRRQRAELAGWLATTIAEETQPVARQRLEELQRTLRHR